MAQHSFLQNLLQGQAVEWKTLGEVAVIGTGNSNRQDESENGDYPFYVRSKNVLRSDSYQFDETAIVIPGEGGVGDIFHYVEGKYALHQRAYRICIHDGDINTKFLYHVMRNSFKQYILSKSVGATATSIRKPMLEKFLIPIPPLSVQAKIVQILDTFTELTEQLTAELGMRQKQYQYYRNKLLTFDFEAVQSLATASDSGWHWYGRLWVRLVMFVCVSAFLKNKHHQMVRSHFTKSELLEKPQMLSFHENYLKNTEQSIIIPKRVMC